MNTEQIIALSINLAIRAVSAVFTFHRHLCPLESLRASNLMLGYATPTRRSRFALFVGVCGFSPFFTKCYRISARIESNQILSSLDLFRAPFVSARQGKYRRTSFFSLKGGRCSRWLFVPRRGLEHALLCNSAPRSRPLIRK